jgi:hypothetical protein
LLSPRQRRPCAARGEAESKNWCSFLHGAAIAVARATASAARHERRDASFSRRSGEAVFCFELTRSRQGF